MDENSQDSFELFADTLTITLGCILFIALLLVVITRSHQMDKSGLFHLERRSGLLNRQISLAENSVSKAENTLQSLTASDPSKEPLILNYESRARAALSAFFRANEPNYATAIAHENIRSQIFFSKYPWMTQTIRSNIQSLDQRIGRAFTEASNEPIALSVLREQNKQAPVPIYIVLKHQKLYPVKGGPGRDYAQISWTRVNQQNESKTNQTWQLDPNREAGLEWDQAEQYLQNLAGQLTRDSESQIVLLVYEDSFELARSLLRELSRNDVNFSWRPFKTGQRILMSHDGLPPEAPL